MAGTIRGLPYPTGTDFVVDGDNAIRELAEAIDERPYFISTGTATVTTSLTKFALTAVEDPFGMVRSNSAFVPAGFGGLWHVSVRLNQSGTAALTGQVRKVLPTPEAALLINSATGQSGAAATPLLSGVVRLSAGDAIGVFATAASGSIAMSLYYPYFSGYFIRA